MLTLESLLIVLGIWLVSSVVFGLLVVRLIPHSQDDA